jgi:hypothetical protein
VDQLQCEVPVIELGLPPAFNAFTAKQPEHIVLGVSCIDRIEPWLSLIGLRLFYERNQTPR